MLDVRHLKPGRDLLRSDAALTCQIKQIREEPEASHLRPFLLILMIQRSDCHSDPFDGAFRLNEIPLFLLLCKLNFLDLAHQQG